jgi:hypothetical protein
MSLELKKNTAYQFVLQSSGPYSPQADPAPQLAVEVSSARTRDRVTVYPVNVLR